jgi:hypothetical protein
MCSNRTSRAASVPQLVGGIGDIGRRTVITPVDKQRDTQDDCKLDESDQQRPQGQHPVVFSNYPGERVAQLICGDEPVIRWQYDQQSGDEPRYAFRATIIRPAQRTATTTSIPSTTRVATATRAATLWRALAARSSLVGVIAAVDKESA